MKAVTQSHPLTWGDAASDGSNTEPSQRQMVVVRRAYYSSSPRHLSPPFLQRESLLISMSRNLALGGNSVQNRSELPREQGGALWWDCNLTLFNNGSPGCSGTFWQPAALQALDTRVCEAGWDSQLRPTAIPLDRTWNILVSSFQVNDLNIIEPKLCFIGGEMKEEFVN